MRLKLLLSGLSLFLGLHLQAQFQIDTSENWMLYMVPGEGTPAEMNKLENSFTADKGLIREIAAALTAEKEFFSTGHSHYTQQFYFVKNGKLEAWVSLLNSTGGVNIADHYYQCDMKTVRKLLKKLQPCVLGKITFSDWEEARLFRDSVRNLKEAYSPDYDTLWYYHEGCLLFRAVLDDISSKMNFNFEPGEIKNISPDSLKTIMELGVQALADSTAALFERADANREQQLRRAIEKDMNAGPEDYKLQLYTLQAGPEPETVLCTYYLYCGEENGRIFSAYEIVTPWRSKLPVTVSVLNRNNQQLLAMARQLGCESAKIQDK